MLLSAGVGHPCLRIEYDTRVNFCSTPFPVSQRGPAIRTDVRLLVRCWNALLAKDIRSSRSGRFSGHIGSRSRGLE